MFSLTVEAGLTVRIPDKLHRAVRRLAARERTTFSKVVEEALRRALAERKPGFRLRDASFKGDGLQPEFQGASWEKIRDAIYEGRGG